jgi:succinyl-CoA synthetase beta subunit
LEGTTVALGKKLLEESKLPIQAASDLAEAAQRVVAGAKAGKTQL